MNDFDGDNSLVCAEPTLVKVAERNMKNIVPLFYNMRKAGAELVTQENIYKGLITAYTGGNIGMISNEITKIWNSENPDINAVKLYCCLNNFVIDYAKTLYKPTIPKEVKKYLKNTAIKKHHIFLYMLKIKKKNKWQK